MKNITHPLLLMFYLIFFTNHLIHAQSVNNPIPKYCTNCGFEIEPGQKFCSNCGAEIIAKPKQAINTSQYYNPCKEAVIAAKNYKATKWFWLGLAYGAGVPLAYFANPTPESVTDLYNLTNDQRESYLECYKIEAKKTAVRKAWMGCCTLFAVVAIANGISSPGTALYRLAH